MLGASARDARRTDRYLDGLMAAEERGAMDAPMDLDVDPTVLFAARHLRAELIRPHPSFRFEEGLANRLSRAAAGLDGIGLATPSAGPGFASVPELASVPDWASPAGFDRQVRQSISSRLPSLTSKSARPLILGASAAISIGAVYVAWRWSRSASRSPMERAVRATRSGHARSAERSRRSAVLHGIIGAIS